MSAACATAPGSTAPGPTALAPPTHVTPPRASPRRYDENRRRFGAHDRMSELQQQDMAKADLKNKTGLVGPASGAPATTPGFSYYSPPKKR